MTALFFAHITDIHISVDGKAWGNLADAATLLKQAFIRFNNLPDLDFVLITGDVLNAASPAEVDILNDALTTLQKPWHFVPGNHDGFIDPAYPDAFLPHEALPLFDSRMADPVPYANQAWWSRTAKKDVQLIGLDSRMADNWNGVIGPSQLAWLKQELAHHKDKSILIAVHHPLLNLGPHNDRSWWSNFIVDNGAEVSALLDQYSNIKLVLSGHHHANRLIRQGSRLHVNTAALTGYPCSYREIRLNDTRTMITTHCILDSEELALARKLLLESDIAEKFAADPEVWVRLCEGSPEDQIFEGILD